MSRQGAALHPSQVVDFDWWKKAWDDAMLEVHGKKWGETFAAWMQNIIHESETKTNAFSVFMHTETNRVLRDRYKNALVVPGIAKERPQ